VLIPLVVSCVGTDLIKYAIGCKVEGKIEGKRRRGRRCKHIQEDLKEKKGCLELEEEALNCTVCELALEDIKKQ